MVDRRSQRTDRRVRIAAGATAAAAFVLYLVTLAWAPVPGAPAALIVKYAGLSDIPSLVHPLWDGLGRCLALLPFGPLAVRVHLACALLAAAAVYLMGIVVARLAGFRPSAPHAGRGAGRDPEPDPDDFRERREESDGWIRALTGVLAGAILALSAPFWIAATRASTAGLESALLLGAAASLLKYHDTGRPSWLVGGAIVWGLGAAESAAMLLLTPLAAVFSVWSMMRHGRLSLFDGPSRRRSAGGGLAWISASALVAAFGVPLGILAIRFALSPAPSWLGLADAQEVAMAAVRAVYGDIKDSVPRVGWLLVALLSAAPALLYAWVRAAPPHRGDGRRIWTCAALAVVGGAVMLNAPFAPWPLFRGETPAVFPYIWIAAWTALAVGTLAQPGRRRVSGRRSARTPGVLAVVSLAIIASGVLNFPAGCGWGATPIGWMANGVMDEAASARWILSRGLWDDTLLVAGFGRTPSPRTLRANLARDPVYCRWFADRGAESPRLAGLSAAGLEAVLPVWLKSADRAPGSIASLDLPQVFTDAGHVPVPGNWIYYCGTNEAPASVRRAGRDIDRWRTEAVRMRRIAESAGTPLREYGLAALRHAARVMNDRGVYLEEISRSEDSIRAYTAAIDANPSNLVARINLSRVVRDLGRMETARIDASLVRYLEELPGPVDIVARTEVDGILRDPAVLVEHGRRRTASGDWSQAVADLMTAVSLGGSNEVAASIAAARALTACGRTSEAIAILDAAEQKHADDEALRLARAHVALATGDSEAAQEALIEIRTDDPRRRITEALVHMARGEWKEADTLLRAEIERSPAEPEILALSALAGMKTGQPARVRAAEEALRAAGRRHPLVSLCLAILLVSENRPGEARHVLESTVVWFPTFRPAREMLIRLEAETGRTGAMKEHVYALLRQFPEDPKANLQLAQWQMDEGHFGLAEASLRSLLGTSRPPIVLNNLAWVVRRQGRAAEALPLAEETVRAAPDFASGWDTLSAVLSDLGRADEARTAAARAASLAPGKHASPHLESGPHADKSSPGSKQ